jgi:hypothetical protein
MEFDAALKSIGDLLAQLKAQHDLKVSGLEDCIQKQRDLLTKAGISEASPEEKEIPVKGGRNLEIPEEGKPSFKSRAESKPSFLSRAESKHSFEIPVEAKKPGFIVKEVWTKVPTAYTFGVDVSDQEANRSLVAMATRVRSNSKLLGLAEAEANDDENIEKSILPFVDPSSPYRMVWDLSGMVLIGYDMVTIPVLIAFEPDTNFFIDFMAFLTLIFWTMDMGLSFITGYYHDGQLVRSHAMIAKNYLKLWFWVDCLVNIPDWVVKVFGEGGQSPAGLGRILRVARIFRVLRLLRLLKLKKLFNILYDMLDSDSMFIVFSLVKMVFIIVMLTHFVGCAWYMIGRWSMDGGTHKNWLEDVGLTPARDMGLLFRYLTSLHWSITQFTPASMDIYATNISERAYSVVILYIALVALSSFIGSISAAVTQLRNMSADESKAMWILRRYLKQKRISKQLSHRIVSYLEFQQENKYNVIPPAQVRLLGQLSEQLKIEMSFEATHTYILDHPIFDYMNQEDIFYKTVCSLCSSAFHLVDIAESETIFSLGDEGTEMVFVRSGALKYTLPNGQNLEGLLNSKLWAAEGVLWTTWRHRGWLQGIEHSEVLALSPKPFADIMHLHPKPAYLGMNYGIDFVNYLNQQDVRTLTDVIFNNDIWASVVRQSDQYELTTDKAFLKPPVISLPVATTKDPPRPAWAHRSGSLSP